MKSILHISSGLVILLSSFPLVSDAQWVQTQGPYGGPGGTLACKGSTVFLASGWGVFRSSDVGATWTATNLNSKSGLLSLAVDDSHLYAGTGSGTILTTTDDGESWILGGSGLPSAVVTALLATRNRLFAGTNGSGLFVSFDSGVHWINADSSNTHPGLNFVSGFAAKGDTVAARAFHAIYVSTDGGQTWNAANNGLEDSSFVTGIGFKDTLLFAATMDDGLYWSSDIGAHWSVRNTSLAHTGTGSFATVGNSLFAAAPGVGVFLSTDDGMSWSTVNIGVPLQIMGGLLAYKANLFVPTSRGIFLSRDTGSSWLSANGGLLNSTVNALTVSGPAILAGTQGTGLFRSTDRGSSWLPRSNGIFEHTVEGDVYAVAKLDPYIFAGAYNDAFRSSDDGVSWTPAGVTTGAVGGFAVKGTEIFAAWSGVSRSIDSGATWTPSYQGIADETYVLAVNGQTLFGGSGWAGVYRSTDDGNNWAAANAGIGHKNIESMLVMDSTVLAGTNGFGVFRSTDSGTTWVSANSGLGNMYVWALASIKGNVFAGTFGGVYSSPDRGTSWSSVNTPGMGFPVYSLVVCDSELYAGTYCRGIWKRPISEMITAVSISVVGPPAHFGLGQNYPNPFNPSTTIRYTVPSRTHVVLSVFNTLGQQVATLVNAIEEPGEHSVRFDGSDVASGVYYYRLQALGFSKTMTLVVVR